MLLFPLVGLGGNALSNALGTFPSGMVGDFGLLGDPNNGGIDYEVGDGSASSSVSLRVNSDGTWTVNEFNTVIDSGIWYSQSFPTPGIGGSFEVQFIVALGTGSGTIANSASSYIAIGQTRSVSLTKNNGSAIARFTVNIRPSADPTQVLTDRADFLVNGVVSDGNKFL